MLLQPNWEVNSPPKKGPKESPRYKVAEKMPSAFPLSPMGKTEEIIAAPVANTIALPIPCRALPAIRTPAFGVIIRSTVDNVKIITPMVKIFLLPYISAIFPKGNVSMAAGRMNAVDTQLNIIASMPNSRLIVGSATMTVEPIKALAKNVNATQKRTILLLVNSVCPAI